MCFCEVLTDAKRIPDRVLAMYETRHLARRRERFERAPTAATLERNEAFLERNLELAHQHPRPKRPRRVGLVGDIEGVHGSRREQGSEATFRLYALRGRRCRRPTTNPRSTHCCNVYGSVPDLDRGQLRTGLRL